jgi:plastocyanin
MTTQANAADDISEIKLVLEHNRFTPEVIKVKAKTAVVLVIENKDNAVEEFDSTALRVERLIPAGKTVRIRLPGLPAGTYEFIGEYHESTAQGRVVAE